MTAMHKVFRVRPALAMVATAMIGATMFMGHCSDLLAAETYPTRTIRLITPYGAGGSYDLIARLMAQRLGEQLGTQVLVDNRPGAAGRIGMAVAQKSNPDGYNLVVIGNNQVIAPIVYENTSYDLQRDFAPIGMVATITHALVVNPALPANSVQELVALSRAKPATIRFGSGGTGGSTHLAGEMFKEVSKADITHVPYKAGIGATNATVSGEIQMTFLNAFGALPLIKTGRLRGLTTTGLKRSPLMPDLLTLVEAGYKYELVEFHGLSAPAGAPASLIARLDGEVRKALGHADTREKLVAQAAEPAPGSPADFRAFLVAEHRKVAAIVKSVGIKPE
jgi:tripartite-type tricarboxylate transporter receptor subunit TctC